jgi:hypothetical protein
VKSCSQPALAACSIGLPRELVTSNPTMTLHLMTVRRLVWPARVI